MNRKRWIYFAKYLIYAGILFVLYVLQTSLDFIGVFDVKPNLVAPAAIGIAVFEGEFLGGLYGALAGVLCDLGGFNLFGFNAIILLISCVGVGLLIIYMLRPTVINYVLLAAGILLIRGLLDFLFNYVMWGYDNAHILLLSRILPTVLYSAAISPLLYYLFGFLHRRFQERLAD